MSRLYLGRLCLAAFTSKSQEDCHKNRTSALAAPAQGAISAIIQDCQDMRVSRASSQRSCCGLLGVRCRSLHGLEARIRAAWFLEAAGHFMSVSLIQKRGR